MSARLIAHLITDQSLAVIYGRGAVFTCCQAVGDGAGF